MKVLAVCYGGGHAQICASVGAELAARGHEVVYLGLTTAFGMLNRMGVPSFGFRDLVTSHDADALALGQSLLAQTNEHPDVAPGESVAYLGLSMLDLIASLGESRARDLYAQQGRQCLVPLTALRRAVDREQPDLILATNSPRAEQAALLVAQERGIPSVCVVDLLLGFDYPRVVQPGYGSRVCVLTEGVRQTLIAGGRPTDEVVVTGNPSFDVLASPAVLNRDFGGKKVVLWVSQPEPTNPRFGFDIAMALHAQFASHPDWQLVVRPHPNEHFPMDELPSGVQVSSQCEPLPAIIRAADAVVVVASTVGVQAVLLGKSLCVLDVPASSEPVAYVEMGLGHGAKLDEAGAVIERILAGDVPTPTGLPEIGQASANVADVIESLVP